MNTEHEHSEVELVVEPREDVLQQLGVTDQEFSVELAKALDDYEAYLDGLSDEDDASPVDEIELTFGGQTVKLGDVADLHLSGDVDFLFDEDGEEDEVAFDDEEE